MCWQVTCEAMVIAVCSLMSPQTRTGKEGGGGEEGRDSKGVTPLAHKCCHSCVARMEKGIKGSVRNLPIGIVLAGIYR